MKVKFPKIRESLGRVNRCVGVALLTIDRPAGNDEEREEIIMREVAKMELAIFQIKHELIK